MKIYRSKFNSLENFFYDLEKVAKINQKIYSQREGQDPPANFRFKRTRKTNFGVIPKNFKTI